MADDGVSCKIELNDLRVVSAHTKKRIAPFSRFLEETVLHMSGHQLLSVAQTCVTFGQRADSLGNAEVF